MPEVLYPGLPSHPQHAGAPADERGGGMVALRTGGGQARAFAVLNRLQLIAISNNLGDAKSLITHPATTTHQRFSAERARLGITDDLLRLSVGLEDPADLIEDLDQALAARRCAPRAPLMRSSAHSCERIGHRSYGGRILPRK